MAHVSVIAAGMVTPVGFNYESSCAAIRAGVRGVKQVNLWDAQNGEYLSGGKVDLPHWWTGIGKLADLVAPAIWECLEAAKPEPARDIPILLGIAPPDRPHRLEGLDEEIMDEVEFRLDLPHHPLSKTIPNGNVSGVIGLREAQNIIDQGLAKYCVVAGVDSFLQQDVVEAYMEQRRIMTATNSNGFFPGEAGCALLVCASTGGGAGELKVLGVGFGNEPATIASTDPLRGSGQIEASRNALSEAGTPMHEIAFRHADLSGEHYKFKEAMLVQNRLLRKRVQKQDIWHPAEFVGEIGAAHVPCVLSVNHCAGKKAFAPGARSLCHFSGDGPERAACVVEVTLKRGT
jgi:3-oxoacyl-[acyl-carrier-protein] synthase I